MSSHAMTSMNEPLRHRGDTYFQADWNKKTEKGTVLQVVRNPAWQLPYWSCAIVALGMLMIADNPQPPKWNAEKAGRYAGAKP